MARPGGVNEPISNFRLVEQDIQVRATGQTGGGSKSFHVRFPNVWDKYKLPKSPKKKCTTTGFRVKCSFGKTN